MADLNSLTGEKTALLNSGEALKKLTNKNSAKKIADLLESLNSQSELSENRLKEIQQSCEDNLATWKQYWDAIGASEKRRKKVESELFDLDEALPNQEVLDSANELRELMSDGKVMDDVEKCTLALLEKIPDKKTRDQLAEVENKLKNNENEIITKVDEFIGKALNVLVHLT